MKEQICVDKIQIESLPFWAIISIFRYALEKQSSIVITTCDWVIEHWNKFPETTQIIIDIK